MDYKLWMASLGEIFAPLVAAVRENLADWLSFFALLLLGWALARVVQALTARLMLALDRLVHSRALRGELPQGGVERRAPEMVGRIVFWIILFFFVVAATEKLGLAVLTNLLSGVAYYLPNVLAAVLIGLAGYLGGNLARSALSRTAAKAGLTQGDLLGRSAQGLIWVVTLLIAIDQMGIDIQFLMALLIIIVAATVGGLALAFGLGARTAVSNLIASHYLSRTYRTGQLVRLGSIQGRISDITPTAVILETQDGRLQIPAKAFAEESSLLLSEEG